MSIISGDDPGNALMGVEVTESTTWAALLRGDQDQWQAFYAAHVSSLDHYFLGQGIRTEDQRDDLIAETFTTFFKQLSKFRPEKATLRAWLFGIAKNRLAKHRSRYAVDAKHVSDEVDLMALRLPEVRPSDPSPAKTEILRLMDAMGGLSERERHILLLRSARTTEAWPWRDLAQELGIGESAAKMIYHRACAKIKQALQDQPNAQGPD